MTIITHYYNSIVDEALSSKEDPFTFKGMGSILEPGKRVRVYYIEKDESGNLFRDRSEHHSKQDSGVVITQPWVGKPPSEGYLNKVNGWEWWLADDSVLPYYVHPDDVME